MAEYFAGERREFELPQASERDAVYAANSNGVDFTGGGELKERLLALESGNPLLF